MIAGAAHRFVGRYTEMQMFKNMLRNPKGKQRSIFIWGPGGIGKTHLIRRMLDEAIKDNNWLVPQEPIDMYSTSCRHIEGVVEAIVERLRPLVTSEDFSSYNIVKSELEQSRTQENYSQEGIKSRLEAVTNAFRGCLQGITNTKPVVLAFDTFEYVQDGPVGHWVLSEQGLQLPSLLCIIASRKPNPLNPDQPALGGLTPEEALALFDRYTELESEISPEYLEFVSKINEMAGGNPLLLGLAILWFDQLGLSVEELEKLNQTEFERHIASWLSPTGVKKSGTIFSGLEEELNEPLRQTLVCMAYLNRRFNRFFLERLVERGYVRGASADQIWQAIDQKLPDFFYIKERPEGEIQLHDKLAEMLRVYVLPGAFDDLSGETLQRFSKDVIKWYDDLIDSTSSDIYRDILRVEKLAYTLQLNILADLQLPRLRQTSEAKHLTHLLQPDFSEASDLLRDFRRLRSDVLDRLVIGEIDPEIASWLPQQEQYEVCSIMGRMAARIYDLERSRDYWIAAVTAAKQVNNLEQQVLALVGWHNSTWQTDPQRSLEILDQALIICNQMVEVEHLHPQVLYETGFTYRQLQALDEAVEWYGKALEMAKHYQNRTITPTILNDMGYALSLVGNYHRARAHIQMAAQLRERIRDELQDKLAEVKQRLPSIGRPDERQRLGELKSSLEDDSYEATLRLGMTYNTLGQLARYTGDMAGATGYYSEAIPIFRNLGSYIWQVLALHSRGEAHRLLSMDLFNQERRQSSQMYDHLAFQDIQASLELCELFGYFDSRDIVYRRLGRLYHDRAFRFADALDEQLKLLNQAQGYFETALRIARQSGHTLEELENLTEIAFLSDDLVRVYKNRSSIRKLNAEEEKEVRANIEQLRQGIERHQNDEPRIYQFPVFENLLKIEEAAFNYELGNYDQALTYYLEGYAGLASDPGYGSVRCRLHLDHLLRNIRRLETIELEKTWYDKFIAKWQDSTMARGEPKSLAEAHQDIFEQFKLSKATGFMTS